MTISGASIRERGGKERREREGQVNYKISYTKIRV